MNLLVSFSYVFSLLNLKICKMKNMNFVYNRILCARRSARFPCTTFIFTCAEKNFFLGREKFFSALGAILPWAGRNERLRNIFTEISLQKYETLVLTLKF